MRLGAHVSIAGALPQAVDRAHALGCECLQIFIGNPRQWRRASYSRADREEFCSRRKAAGLDPLVAHASYLVNPASADRELRARAAGSLVESMRVIEQLDGLGVVTHLGSRGTGTLGGAVRRTAATARAVLRDTARARLLLENSAGGTLGGTFEELRDILAALGGDERVGVCLDTAHLFAAGWDLRHAQGVAAMLDRFERVVGLERLWLFHLNDSRAPLGSRLDRHENIGAGHIGREGFRALMAEPRVAALAGVLEVPGFSGAGPDRRNLTILKKLEREGGSRAGKAGARRTSRATPGPATRRGAGPGSSPSR